MIKENDWDRITKTNMVEGPIEKNYLEEIMIGIKAIKPGKAAGLSEVIAAMISARGEIRIGVIMECCQRVLNGARIPDEWQTNVLVPIFSGKCDAKHCNTYKEIKPSLFFWSSLLFWGT